MEEPTHSETEQPAIHKRENWWLDNDDNVSKLVYGLYATAAILFLFDFFYHKHVYFDFENWPGFYAVFGFLSYVGLIFVAVRFRRLVKRDETYYEK